MEHYIGILGVFVLLGLAWLLSSHKRLIPWRVIFFGIGLQILLAVVILKTQAGAQLFQAANEGVNTILDCTRAGTSFIFGEKLASPAGPAGFVFAFQVLPAIIFFAGLTSLAYHWGLLQPVVEFLARLMLRVLGTSGAETLSVTANIFLGHTQVPLLIKPYVEKMTRSELMTLMTGGFATCAGGTMAAYASMGINAGHLLAASFMSAPAALVMAKIMEPETGEPLTRGTVRVEAPRVHRNSIDALADGATEGLKLALAVAAILLVFIAAVELVNLSLHAVGGWFGHPELALSVIFGYVFAPVAFFMGVPTGECLRFGNLLGTMISVTEFMAYIDLAHAIKAQEISARSATIATYALCGFANIGSIAMQIGAIGALVPSRRSELADLGLRAMIGGALACYMTATIAGLLL